MYTVSQYICCYRYSRMPKQSYYLREVVFDFCVTLPLCQDGQHSTVNKMVNINIQGTYIQTLYKVMLRVSTKRYEHTKMFGTELTKKNGVYQVQIQTHMWRNSTY